MELSIDRMISPIGAILLVWQGGELRALQFSDCALRLDRTLQLQYGSYRLSLGRAPAALRDPLDAYFEGDLRAIDRIPVQMRGRPFQQEVWAMLREIPPGETRTYGELATQLGRPKASRAVGLANGSNPISIVVPCHRLIGAKGALTGYGGGIERKRWLLAHEGNEFQADRLAGSNKNTIM